MWEKSKAIANQLQCWSLYKTHISISYDLENIIKTEYFTIAFNRYKKYSSYVILEATVSHM